MTTSGETGGTGGGSGDAGSAPIVVIGAGIVGMACALNLLRDGHKVTVVDRLPPGEGTSFGNAGVFATAAVVPVPVPGVWKKVPGMLMDPHGALRLRWTQLPRMAPWLLKFLSHGRREEVIRISAALADILGDSANEHAQLARGTPAERYVRASDYFYLYKDRAAFEGDAFGWSLRKQHGARWEVLEGDAVREAEPALGTTNQCAVVLKDHGQAWEPSRLVKGLAEAFVAGGGTILQRDVTDLDIGPDRVRAVLTPEGRIDCDRLVIAAGVWSAKLAARLGSKVPLESERGYHVTVADPGVEIHRPLAYAAAKVVATPMEDGIRMAGLVEFGGLNAPPDPRRWETLLHHLRILLPGIRTDKVTTWMGHRPSLPDSLPVIGPARGLPNVLYAFGHQHVGLTGGPKTGRLIADLVAGRTPNIDMAPFSVERFG